jgi:hypothetical protein
MMSVFLRNGDYAAHVAFWFRPFLGCFGEKMFDSRRLNIDEHTNRLIGIIFESVDRAAGGVNAIPRGQLRPGAIDKKVNPALEDIEPFVFAFVVMRPGPPPGGLILRKAVNFSPVCLPSSSMTSVSPNAYSVRPWLARTRRELPIGKTGRLFSTFDGLIGGVFERKATSMQAPFTDPATLAHSHVCPYPDVL